MDAVLDLLAEIDRRGDDVRTLHVMVKFAGAEDFKAAGFTVDVDDLIFQLATERLRLLTGR